MADPKKTEAAKAPKAKVRKMVVNLSNGTGGELKITAIESKGKFLSFAYHALRAKNEAGKTKKVGGHGRGATQVHKTFEAAVAAVEAGVVQAVSKGWTKKAPGAFGSRPDAFGPDAIPAA